MINITSRNLFIICVADVGLIGVSLSDPSHCQVSGMSVVFTKDYLKADKWYVQCALMMYIFITKL